MSDNQSSPLLLSLCQRHFAYVLDCTVNSRLTDDAECPSDDHTYAQTLDSHHFWLQAAGDVQTVNLTIPAHQQSVFLSCRCLRTGRMGPAQGKVQQGLISITFEPAVKEGLAVFAHQRDKRFLTWLTYVDVYGEDAGELRSGKKRK